MNKLLRLSLAAVFGALVMITTGSLGVGGQPKAAALSLPAPVTTFAASEAYCERQANPLGFFGLEPWYHFMPDADFGEHGSPCAVHCFNIFIQSAPNECGQKNSDIPGVVLAIIDDLLRIGALVAVAFILIGSFQFIGSRGNSDRTASAQSTITAALTGLAICLVAVAFVSFIGNRIGG